VGGGFPVERNEFWLRDMTLLLQISNIKVILRLHETAEDFDCRAVADIRLFARCQVQRGSSSNRAS
jgi:hypothetical protein